MEGVAERLGEIRDRISRAGGDWRSVPVVAVTKGFGLDALEQAYQAGLRDFAENYTEALLGRTKAMGRPWFTTPPRWHYLGAVQRNKVRRLAPHVSLWQGVDRVAEGVDIARRARCGSDGAGERHRRTTAKRLHLRGGSRAGRRAARAGSRRARPDVRGPRDDPRTAFARLAMAAKETGVTELSMGMSTDFEVAVQEGSTMLRLGSALFGPRPAPDRR